MPAAAALDAVHFTIEPSLQRGLTVGLATMIFAVALTLRTNHFAFLRTDPARFAAGLLTQIVALPALTVGLAFLIAPSAPIALGMIVVACCPGGNVSNLMTHFARGDAAFSVALTATSSVLAAVVTPVSILFWSGVYPPTAELVRTIELNPAGFLIQTGLALGLPLVIGMTIAMRAPGVAARIQPFFAVVALGVLVLLVAGGLWQSRDVVAVLTLEVGPIVGLHNMAAFGLGAFVGWAIRAGGPQRRALAFEIGIQNTGLALLLLVTQFDALSGAAAVAGTWSIWHLSAGLAVVGALRLWDRRRGAAR